jgi:hypothetical protein
MPNDIFSELLINPKTKTQLNSFINNPAHALLITGPSGSGRQTLSRALSAHLLSIKPDRLSSHPYFFFISKPEDKTDIPIESIRQLINKVSLKVADQIDEKTSINRIALIDDAQNLSTEAQNAVLKLLEEPPAKTLLILTADSDDAVLPTVASRAQKIRVVPVDLSQTLNYFESKYSKDKISSAWRLGQGSAGLITALLSDDTEHPLKLGVDMAKEFISKDTYNRVIYLQALAKDKAEFYIFLEALARVLAALHAANPDSRKFLSSRQKLQEIIKGCEANANTRLSALALAIDIPL